MNVLVLCNLYPPDFIGGYEVACLQVVDGLRVRGHDVRVLTSVPRQPVPKVDHVLRRLRLTDEWNPNVLGDYAVNHLTTHAHSRFVDAHNVYTLTRAIEAWPPDVAYLTNLVGVGGLGLVATLEHLNIPWVWQLGDCAPALLCHGRGGILQGLAEAYSRAARGRYIIVSEGVKRETECFGVKLNGPTTLLPYWIVGNRPPPRRVFYQSGHLRVMSAGSVNRDKGVDILIEAAGQLRSLGVHDFSVDIYGKVGDRSLRELVRALDVDDIVTFKGTRPHDELMNLYGEYDVFAFPTFAREPFGMVPLEAASRGCVPLMSHCCGVSEWLVHGVHCLKAERTPLAFAHALHDVCRGKIALSPIARRAAEAVWRDFHLDAILPGIEEVLAEAATDSTAAPTRASSAEIYRMARMAEQLAESLIDDEMMVQGAVRKR